MKIAFDIGGCISKYPEQFRDMARLLHVNGHLVYVITDMHDHDAVVAQLNANGFCFIPPEQVYCADYIKHGELCKAVLLKELQIDMFFDDFVGYCMWDSSFGPPPIRLLVMPDGFRPYWHENWQTKDGQDFGRRVRELFD